MSTTTDVPARLAEVIGSKRIVAAAEELETYAVDGRLPGAIVRPVSTEEAIEVVRFARTEKLAILPLGGRSKCEVGMTPDRYDIALDMTGLREIAHYDPGDLTLSVDAGMRLRELEIHLKQHGQVLPLAVPCFESATVGGSVSCGIDSALRLQYGSVRDFVIGAEFIDGTGQLCKSGGRVVKNVTGYDLHKLLIGSLGTLGVLTRVNFRTYPLPAISGGYVACFGNAQEALVFKKAVEKSGLPLANLELFDQRAARMIHAILARTEEASLPELEREEWCAYGSFEGSEEVVRRIGGELEKITRESGTGHSRILEPAEDVVLGGMLRESFEWLRWGAPATLLCRLALPEVTEKVSTELSQLAGSLGLASAVIVRAAGIVYLGVFAETENEEAITALQKMATSAMAIARSENGHATLLHAPLMVKRSVVGANLSQAQTGLQQRVKQAFDPSGVFAPGRVVGGI
ncbi:MAG TPA: FAD-binding oxidoreductase [Candidatus Sulfotelmatobacter sp.]|nr:FAD-binding oxidoreductase [Candidatus Sulfotelmatobacter sp.]